MLLHGTVKLKWNCINGCNMYQTMPVHANCSTCMLYSTWKLSMNTSLITNALGVASHIEESAETSNIIFLNSEMKLLNSSLQLSLAGVGISCRSAFYPETSYEKFLLSYTVFSFVDLYFEGELSLGAVGQSFL